MAQLSIRYTLGNRFLDLDSRYINGNKAKGNPITIAKAVARAEQETGKTLNEWYITSRWTTADDRKALEQAIRNR